MNIIAVGDICCVVLGLLLAVPRSLFLTFDLLAR